MATNRKSAADVSESGPSSASPSFIHRPIKLNPVSAPGLKPVSPPPTSPHSKHPPITTQELQTHCAVYPPNNPSLQTHGYTSRSPHNRSSSLNRGGVVGSPKDFSSLSDAETSPPVSLASFLPSSTSPLNPLESETPFAPRRRKIGKSGFDQASSGMQCIVGSSGGKDNKDALSPDGSGFEMGARPSRGHRIQIPPTRESRSLSPMTRRGHVTGNALTPVSSGAASSSVVSFTSGLDERGRSPSRGSSVSPTSGENSGTFCQTSTLVPHQELSSAAPSASIDSKTTTGAVTQRSSGRPSRTTTAAATFTMGGISSKKSSSKIDINYSPASPLSPRKRQEAINSRNSTEPFQENYRFFLRGGSSDDNEGGFKNNSNSNNDAERVGRMFSPAPVRDIFSPLSSASTSDPTYTDLLESYADLKVTSCKTTKGGKRVSTPGIVFPAIRVENVDDKNSRAGEASFCDKSEEIVDGSISVSPAGRKSKSSTSSSASSASTSPSPTSTSPTEFLRSKPFRTRSTNALLGAEASSVIDSWLSPTHLTTPLPCSTPSRHNPENARFNWRKCGSSSTSCLLSVPSPVIKRQTSEGRVIVEVLDALTVPGEGGAGRKGMMSRGWSRSESNLFVRTGKPVGGAGQGGLTADDIFDEDLGYTNTRKGSVHRKPPSGHPNPAAASPKDTVEAVRGKDKDGRLSLYSPVQSSKQNSKQQQFYQHQNQDFRQAVIPPTLVTPDEKDLDLPSLAPRHVLGRRPSHRGGQSTGQSGGQKQ